VSCEGDELFAGRAWQATVSNTGAFGAGAGVDAADPYDGVLDATVIEAGPRPRLGLHGLGLRAGRITRQRGVRTARGRVVRVELAPDTELNVDGELVRTGSASFRLEPQAFSLVVG
jgi:diacylglycerol kinase family enzyme